jgi:hypothetical protein
MSHQNFDVIPYFTIHPSCINLYNRIEPSIPHSQYVSYHDIKKEINIQTGNLSVNANRKIKRAIDYTLLLSNDKIVNINESGKYFKFKIALITLTLSSIQIHTDNEIKDILLNQLLVELRRVYKIKHYVWRAEKQQNNNIHFHILTNKFIPWNDLRNRWNRIQQKLGYIDRYRDQMRNFHKDGFTVRKDLLENWSYKSQLKAYKEGLKCDWDNPNSVDIHSVRFVQNIKQYVTKYMAKDSLNMLESKYYKELLIKLKNKIELNASEQILFKELSSKIVQGRLWGCSEILSDIKGAQGIVDSYVSSEISYLKKKTNCKTINETYFSVLYITINDIIHANCTVLLSLINEYLYTTFDYNIQLKLNTS